MDEQNERDVEIVQTGMIPTSDGRTSHYVAAEAYAGHAGSPQTGGIQDGCGHEHTVQEDAVACALENDLPMVVHVRYEQAKPRTMIMPDHGEVEDWDA